MSDTPFEKIRADFARDGYVVVPSFLPATICAAVNAEIRGHYADVLARTDVPKEKLLVDHPENFRQFECDVIAWHPCGENNRVFCDLRDSAGLREVTEACLGPGWTGPGGMVMLSIGGGKGQAWHQDSFPSSPRAFNLNRLIYTEDVNVADGAVVVVPGSHRMGRIPPGENQEPIAGEVVLEPRAGTLVLLNGHVYHRVTPNLTGRPRVSVNFRAYPQGVGPEVCAVGVYRNGAYDFRTKQVVQK